MNHLNTLETARSVELARMDDLDAKLDRAIEDTIKAKAIWSYQKQFPVSSVTYSPILDETLQSGALRELVRNEIESLISAHPILVLVAFRNFSVYDDLWMKLQKSGVLSILKKLEIALPPL